MQKEVQFNSITELYNHYHNFKIFIVTSKKSLHSYNSLTTMPPLFFAKLYITVNDLSMDLHIQLFSCKWCCITWSLCLLLLFIMHLKFIHVDRLVSLETKSSFGNHPVLEIKFRTSYDINMRSTNRTICMDYVYCSFTFHCQTVVQCMVNSQYYSFISWWIFRLFRSYDK